MTNQQALVALYLLQDFRCVRGHDHVCSPDWFWRQRVGTVTGKALEMAS